MRCLLFTAILILHGYLCFSTVTLPHILGSNMVLKQKSKVNLWGKAEPGIKVTIMTSWNGRSVTADADQAGNWKTSITTPSAGGPYKITFDDGVKITLDNVMLGEVWLCSGQSNMYMPMKGNPGQPILNSEKIIADATNNSLRLFTVTKALSKEIKNDCDGNWVVSSPQTARDFSALAFQFGQMLQKKLNVPVGMINTSYGGTPIRSWMGDSFDEFAAMYPTPKADEGPKAPKVLYNAMIAPLIPFTISGFLWYQGEGDRMSPDLYKKMMPAMVNEWREKWGQGNLGFYYAEIAPWLYAEDRKPNQAPYLREAQFETLKDMGRSGMAVTADVGSDQAIHPPDKTTVAERLLKIALAETYDHKINYKGPEYVSIAIKGTVAILNFKHADGGLVLKNRGLENFEIAGEDQIFHPAAVKITGSKLEVSSEKVSVPVAVRYAFKNYGVADLYSKEGLPAVPFRTDKWEKEE